MAENCYTLITDIGKAKIANSIPMGTKVNFTKFKVGDSKGVYYEPTESQTDLVNTKWEGPIGSVYVDENNPNWIVVDTVLPADIGGFYIREAGIFDENNNLIAISKLSESYKPVFEDGTTKEMLIRLILEVSNTSTISLKVDPTVILATQKDIKTLTSSINLVNAQLSDFVYQTAGGTGTALTVTIKGTLVNGYPVTFIASANNSGAATTLNGKKLYKPGTTTAPNLITGKAYTVWYNQAGDCFFIKASAEGDAVAANVLAGKKFSNDNDTGLVGTLDLSNLASGNVKSGVTINGVSGKSSVVDTADANASTGQILNGQTAYINGNKVIGNMPNHSGADSPANSIAGTGVGRIYVRPQAGYYDGSVASYVDDSNFNAANIVNGKSILGLAGQATVASLGGLRKMVFNRLSVPAKSSSGVSTSYSVPATPIMITGSYFSCPTYPGLYEQARIKILINTQTDTGPAFTFYDAYIARIQIVTNGFTITTMGYGNTDPIWIDVTVYY